MLDMLTPIAEKTPRYYVFARGLCLFFGVFALLNVIFCLRGGDAVQNMNIWWIDLTVIKWGDTHVGFALEALAAAAMIVWAIRPRACMVRRVITALLMLALALIAVQNAVSYWRALGSGSLYWALPVPLSMVIAVIFLVLVWRVLRANPKHVGMYVSLVGVIGVAVVAALVFPLLQIGFFGTTDYRRDADAAVVMGARVYEDGELSPALKERMDTAISLYKEGYVDRLIVSGGIEEGNVDEAQAMYKYATDAGVPSSALLIDRYGSSTEASVTNTIKLLKRYKLEKIIATSSFYHLPRIKMLYNLRNIDVVTVPTVGNIFQNGTFFSIWREIPAWWYYWVKGSL